MEWNEFCEKITKIFGIFGERISLVTDDGKISYTILSQNHIYRIDEYQILRHTAESYTFSPYSKYNSNTFECIVDLPDVDSRRHFMIGFEDKISNLSIRNEENKISYSFCKVSNELIWYILKEYDSSKRVFPRFPSSFLERKMESSEEKDIFSLLKVILRLPFSVCITSDRPTTQEVLSKNAKSFLFNFAYNLDFVLKPVTDSAEIFPQRTFTSKRRIHNINEIMPPHLAYKSELTEQYYMALASQDPFVQFIGFYHIMEHFYEEVYNEDLFENVQHIIQHPGFSSKRKKDIVKVIELIKKKTRQNKEDFQGSELEALELTIKKFIDISELNHDLEEYDSSIIHYYKIHQVSFSDGDTIDLKDSNNEKLPKKLAARIYKTRNSLVHSKSKDGRINERGIYKPFYDSQELLLEIPLMRYISEVIIINSAEPL